MDLSQLLSLSYLLEKSPTGDFLFGFVLLGFFLLVTFIGSILKNPAKNNKHLRKSLRKRLWKFPFLGVIGIFLVLARFATLPIFSMRIVLLGLLILTLFISVVTFYTVNKEYRRRKNSAAREAKKRGKTL
jgi:O-antigen/teichoic acid export membrane protein